MPSSPPVSSLSEAFVAEADGVVEDLERVCTSVRVTSDSMTMSGPGVGSLGAGVFGVSLAGGGVTAVSREGSGGAEEADGGGGVEEAEGVEGVEGVDGVGGGGGGGGGWDAGVEGSGSGAELLCLG